MPFDFIISFNWLRWEKGNPIHIWIFKIWHSLNFFTSSTNLWNSPVPSKYYILSVSLTSSFSHSLSYLLSILFSLLHSHYTVSHILTPVTVFHSSTFAHSFSFFPSLPCMSPEKNTKTLFSLQIYQVYLEITQISFQPQKLIISQLFWILPIKYIFQKIELKFYQDSFCYDFKM